MGWMDFPPLNQVGPQQGWNDGYSGGWSDGQSGGYMMALTRGKATGAPTTVQTTVPIPVPTPAPYPVPSKPQGQPQGCKVGSVHSRRFMANDPSGQAAAPSPKTSLLAPGQSQVTTVRPCLLAPGALTGNLYGGRPDLGNIGEKREVGSQGGAKAGPQAQPTLTEMKRLQAARSRGPCDTQSFQDNGHQT